MSGELSKPKIKLQGRAARTHTEANPLKYPSEDGLKWEYEYRDLAELEKIREQLVGKPVTFEHPDTLGIDGGDLEPITIGVVTDAHLDGEEIVVDYEVELPLDEVPQILPKRQLSLGYKSGLNQNRVQRLTQVDHLAMTERARGGDTLETRMDSARAHFDAMDAPIQLAHASDMPHTTDVAEAHLDGDLNAKERNALSGEEFADPKGRKLPIENADHVRAAMSRFNQTDFADAAERKTAYHKIVAKAHELGVDASGFEKSNGSHMDQAEIQTKLDAADAALKIAGEEIAALKTKLDSAETEKQASELAAREAKKDLENLQGKFDAEVKVHKDAAEALKTEHDAVKAKMDSDAKAHFDSAVKERIEVLRAAEEILPAPTGEEKPFIDRDSTELKIAIVAHVDSEDVSGKPQAWIDGCFVGARKRAARGEASVAASRQALSTARKDAAESLKTEATNREAELKSKMETDSASRWNRKN